MRNTAKLVAPDGSTAPYTFETKALPAPPPAALMRHRYKDRACRNELSCSWRLGTRDSKATTNYYVQISTLKLIMNQYVFHD